MRLRFLVATTAPTLTASRLLIHFSPAPFRKAPDQRCNFLLLFEPFGWLRETWINGKNNQFAALLVRNLFDFAFRNFSDHINTKCNCFWNKHGGPAGPLWPVARIVAFLCWKQGSEPVKGFEHRGVPMPVYQL